jgi:Tetratricopeptide repeat
METRKAILGPEHPDTLTSMANLASTYQNQGRWVEAEKLQVQVMEIRRTVLGPEHPSTLTSIWNLSHIWKQQGRDNDALAMLEVCVPLLNQQLGPNHPLATTATANFQEWQTPVHHPLSHTSPGSSSGRHEFQLSTEGLQPSDQPLKPRKRDIIKRLFRRK